MESLYWHGVTISFICHSCKKVSVEKMAMSSPTLDRAAINREINSQILVCQLCKTPLLNGTEVSVNVQPDGPQRLKDLGFPVPAEFLTPPDSKK